MTRVFPASCIVLVVFLAFSSCVEHSNRDNRTDSQTPAESPVDPFELNEKLGKGINLGNALEAPNEGDWGMVVEEEYIELIRRAGFDAVRIPILWNAHAQNTPPYRIDPAFFERVDEVVGWILERDLLAMVNIHHYDALMEQPGEQRKRFISIWEQITEHYQDFPNTLLFEVLNEPRGNLESDAWNVFFRDAVNTIRESNPSRTVVIGTAPWGGFGGVEDLALPDSERNLIVTVHYYNPFQFIHQGADWAGDEAEEWLGPPWTGTEGQKAEVDEELESLSVCA